MWFISKVGEVRGAGRKPIVNVYIDGELVQTLPHSTYKGAKSSRMRTQVAVLGNG